MSYKKSIQRPATNLMHSGWLRRYLLNVVRLRMFRNRIISAMPTATGFSFSIVLTVRYHPSHVSLGESITLGDGLVDLAFVRTGSHGLCKEPSPFCVAFRQANLKWGLV